MKRISSFLIVLSLVLSCHKSAVELAPADEQQQEVDATIVTFDSTKHICGYSWIIQIGAKQYRAKTVPEAYQKPN